MTTHDESDNAPELCAEVETSYLRGTWCTRRCDSDQPFASGASRQRLIAIGVEVARWNHLRHIIRDTEGNIVEINTYVSGPYPARSPISREHPGG
ncbi:MAG: hypothetical protein ACRDP9_04380 [Kribbellaceae bacterium]